jgi:uncharacterized protein YegJ (DUF2314 family)
MAMMMKGNNHSLTVLGSSVYIAAVLAAGGCEHRPAKESAAPPVQPVKSGPAWIVHGESVVLPARAPEDDAALAAAIEQARRTAAEARQRWEHAPADDRGHWAVKWAAPLETGEVEYLWVRPTHWSPFRIEGVLLSEPVHELQDGGAKGDNVSFPAEQFVDWAHAVGGASPAVVEGNFTEAALTRRDLNDVKQ